MKKLKKMASVLAPLIEQKEQMSELKNTAFPYLTAGTVIDENVLWDLIKTELIKCGVDLETDNRSLLASSIIEAITNYQSENVAAL